MCCYRVLRPHHLFFLHEPSPSGRGHFTHTLSLVAERSEANNRDLWAQQSQLASIYTYIYIYIYIYFHMGDVCHAWGAPGQQHVFKMASLVVTWMPSSNLWRPKTQTFGQIYHILLPGKAYYSSQVSRVYVHSV